MVESPIPRQSGFTLIELLVTVAVIAVLALVAIPNLRDLVHANRLRAGVNEVAASLQAARSEAVRLNARVVMCRTDGSPACLGSGGQWTNWVVLADLDRDGANDVVRTGNVEAPVSILASSNLAAGTITFGPDGIARTTAGVPLQANLGVCITSSSLTENLRLLSVRTGSRLVIARGSASCGTAPSNPT